MKEQELDRIIGSIKPVSKEWYDKAFARLDSLTKPRRSLGQLEELAARYVAIREEGKPAPLKKRIMVFAGDHGVTAEGVSAYPSEVTGLMVKNFVGGGAAINVLARRAGADVEVIDIGVATDLGNLPGLLRKNVRRGAGNIATGPAMTRNEALQAIGVGIERANKAAADGVSIAATGDMGIGNTTPSAALMAIWLTLPAAKLAGRGTGLDESGVTHKVAVIERAIATNGKLCTDPLGTLAALGGLEIAGICGLCLGAAAKRIAVVVDGFISSAGAIAAMRMCPQVKDYLFFSHMSAETGHREFFEAERLHAILDLNMRLGEGTGAAIAMQIIEDAVAIYNEMATFADVGITPGA
jgi:nicotinate-nucleotide--dimethylbenzimidazole phosphoribosyltransferase